jgi:hypothetical protein
LKAIGLFAGLSSGPGAGNRGEASLVKQIAQTEGGRIVRNGEYNFQIRKYVENYFIYAIVQSRRESE